MAYSEVLAERVRAILSGRDVVEKKMMGGLTFLVDGRMVCGIFRDDLLARVGAEGHDEALARPHVRVMDFSGRVMRGFVVVEIAGLPTRRSLERWIDIGLAVANAAPTKRSPAKTSPAKTSSANAKREKAAGAKNAANAKNAVGAKRARQVPRRNG